MRKSTTTASLKSILPESYWSWVIPALKHDRLVWEILSDPDFFELASEKLKLPEEWTPSQIALLYLDYPDLESFNEPAVKKGQETLDFYLQVDSPPVQEQMDFELAAYLSIGLFHRFKNGDWQDIDEMLSSQSGWFTPFTILSSLVPDRTKLNELLLSNKQSKNIIPLIVDSLLGQPVPAEVLQELFKDTITKLEITDVSRMLSCLKFNRPEITINLANNWIENNPVELIKSKSYTIGDQVDQITGYLLMAEIYSLAGRIKDADQIRTQSINLLRDIQSDVANRLIGESLQRNNIEYSLSVWSNASTPPEFSPPAGLIIKLLKSGRIDDSLTLLPETEGHTQTPLRWLNNVYQALEQEDINQARLFAHQTLNSFVESNSTDPKLNEKLLGTRIDVLAFLIELVQLLSDLALYKEAFQAAQIAAEIQPDDPEIQNLLSKVSRSAAEYDASIEAAEYAVALTPDNPEYMRQLSLSLEAAEMWEDALHVRQKVLEHRFARKGDPVWPTMKDLLALANCSLRAGQPQLAYETSQKAIEQDSSSGHAHAILGEALSAIGEDDQAMEHFSLATQLAPHKAEPWLSLARALDRAGHSEKSIETLRTASHAVPDDPSIFFALGKAHLEDEAVTLAQTALERAYQLVSQPNSEITQLVSQGKTRKSADIFARTREQQCEIALAYGNTLNLLGHPDQAIEVYESAYQAYPSFPGLAHIYAKSLLESGEETSALAPLAIAVSAQPNEPQPYLDYARILLTAKEHPEQAVQALNTSLEMLGDLIEEAEKTGGSEAIKSDLRATRDLATGYLAQAQEASGDFEASLNTYSQALESGLAQNENWKADLSIGLGRVALNLGEPEIAIAALQDSDRDQIQDTEVAQILCEAYTAISLTHEALFAARTAVHLAPDDMKVLAWFADRAVELGATAEAIPALTSAVELDPQRTDLIIKLGEVYTQVGKTKPAIEAFTSVISSPYATSEDLYLSADGLSDLGDNDAAAQCLERALELESHPPMSLLIDLASAYKFAGKTELAIKTIDKGINIDSEDAQLHIFKADLLGELGRNQAAQACLEHALILNPDDPQTHLRIAHILRKLGDIICAFDHADAAMKHLDPDSSQDIVLGIKGLTAELARATLQEQYAEQLLADLSQSGDPEPTENKSNIGENLFAYYCIAAESALDREEQIAAGTALNEAFAFDPHNPRVLALQSRMALRQGDHALAMESFQSAISGAKSPDNNQSLSPTELLGLGLAAIELYQWDLALEFFEEAVSKSPNESYLLLQKARLIVLRAEFQRLCQTLDIINHTPGAVALSPRTFRLFEETIQATVNSLMDDLQAENPEILVRWRNRGLVAFHPSQEAIQNFSKLLLESSDQAALIEAFARRGDMEQITNLFHAIQSESKTTLINHKVLAKYALSIFMNHEVGGIEEAKNAIFKAIEQNPTESSYYVIQARLAHLAGEITASIRAMQKALTFWPDEPRWQAYTANLALLNESYTDAVTHLEKAISVEPEHLSHYLELGNVYLKSGQPAQAIVPLKQAVKIAPDNAEVYLSLAAAQLANRNYSQAARSTEKASELEPEKIAPLLLNADISLRIDDPAKAKSLAEAALRIKQNDPHALFMQARAFEAMGNEEQALVILEKAIPLSSDPLPLLLRKTKLMAGSDRLLAELQELSIQYPDEPKVLAPLSQAFADAGQTEDAIQSAQQALRRGNGNLTLDERASLHLLLGTQLRNVGQLDQSIHHLSEAIKVTPEHVETLLELGITQEERRQHESALETYKQAIRKFPTDPRPYYQAGMLLKAGRDYPAAESMLRRASENAPDDLKIHRQLAGLVALNLVHNRQAVSTEV